MDQQTRGMCAEGSQENIAQEKLLLAWAGCHERLEGKELLVFSRCDLRKGDKIRSSLGGHELLLEILL